MVGGLLSPLLLRGNKRRRRRHSVIVDERNREWNSIYYYARKFSSAHSITGITCVIIIGGIHLWQLKKGNHNQVTIISIKCQSQQTIKSDWDLWIPDLHKTFSWLPCLSHSIVGILSFILWYHQTTSGSNPTTKCLETRKRIRTKLSSIISLSLDLQQTSKFSR